MFTSTAVIAVNSCNVQAEEEREEWGEGTDQNAHA